MSDSLDNLADQLSADAGAVSGGDGGSGNQNSSQLDEKKDRNLQLILDIPLRVTVELGRSRQ